MDLLSDEKAFSSYGSNKYIDGTKEFLSSNSLVAKFAFLILVVIVFVILLRLGTYILTYIFSPSPTPYLIHGMIDSKKQHTISQDPKINGSIPVMRSVDQRDGLEFTWSVWIYLDDVNYFQNRYKHVFHKGNDRVGSDGLISPNNAPGLYISPVDEEKNMMNLLVRMNIFTDQSNENNLTKLTGEPNIYDDIVIEDLPINKWVNIIIRCDTENVLDVYINGTLVKRHKLSGVARQNYDNVYVSMNGGFSGFTSDLHYFNYAIGTFKIDQIVMAGPNMKMEDANLKDSMPKYLSTRWFFSETDKLYQPV